MTEQEVRDQVMTMLIAGHETTAAALTWTLYLLARNPRVESKLRGELSSVLAGRPPTVEDFSALPYLQQVVKESLRARS